MVFFLVLLILFPSLSPSSSPEQQHPDVLQAAHAGIIACEVRRQRFLAHAQNGTANEL